MSRNDKENSNNKSASDEDDVTFDKRFKRQTSTPPPPTQLRHHQQQMQPAAHSVSVQTTAAHHLPQQQQRHDSPTPQHVMPRAVNNSIGHHGDQHNNWGRQTPPPLRQTPLLPPQLQHSTLSTRSSLAQHAQGNENVLGDFDHNSNSNNTTPVVAVRGDAIAGRALSRTPSPHIFFNVRVNNSGGNNSGGNISSGNNHANANNNARNSANNNARYHVAAVAAAPAAPVRRLQQAVPRLEEARRFFGRAVRHRRARAARRAARRALRSRWNAEWAARGVGAAVVYCGRAIDAAAQWLAQQMSRLHRRLRQ